MSPPGPPPRTTRGDRSRPVPPAQVPPAPAGQPRPLLQTGDVLARRYRLLEALPTARGARATTWRAADEVLARPVAVRALPARDPAATRFLEAAADAGAVGARPLARVYDAAAEPRTRRPGVAYVIREWIEGQALPDLVASGPLPPARALALAVTAAEALVELHAAGVVHGRIHPGNVVVEPAGRLRLTDAVTAAALTDSAPAGRDRRGDVRDLVAVLYALTTARWPDTGTGQPSRGIPPAPRNDGGTCSPRQVRAGVPRALDAVVDRGLHPGRRRDLPALDTAPALLAALEEAAEEVGREEPEAAPSRVEPREPGRLRRLLPYGLAAALVAGTAAVCYSLGLSIGEVPPVEDGVSADGGLDAPAAPGGRAAVPLDLRRYDVRDFDPYGRPREEKSDQVVNAYDGEPSTAWATDLYRSPRFGGLKSGVGLLVDLRKPVPLARVDVDVTSPGTRLELRAGNTLGEDERLLAVAATSDTRTGRVRFEVPEGTPARYWLLWITELPADAGQYRAGVDELRLARR